MSAHTPGPWSVFTDNREDMGGLVYVAGYNIIAPGQTIVGEEGICSSRNGKANAHLIAAAPDLLAICERIHDELTLRSELHEQLSAAIAKAKGGAA